MAGIPGIDPGRVTSMTGPAKTSEREKTIKAAEKEYADDPMMRDGKTEKRHYVNAALREQGLSELTAAEAETLKGAA